MADYETITYEVRNGVAHVTLDRPEVHNAFNAAMMRELRDCWERVRRDDAVRCVLLTGAGEKAFCTGIDRTEQIGDAAATGDAGASDAKMVGGVGGPFQFDDPGDYICPKTNDLWKPIVAAINGMACGGAFYLLGEVDIVIAAEHATFFDPHVTYGMVAAFEPMHLLQKAPIGEVLRLSLLGAHERMSAQRAHQIGLVSEVVPADELSDAATWVAERIASAPALAVQGTVRAIWGAQEHSWRQAIQLGYAYVAMGTDRASLEEGQQAFASGQRIDWRLR